MEMAKRIVEIKKIAQGLAIHNPYLNLDLIDKVNELKQFLTAIDHLNNSTSSLTRLVNELQVVNHEANHKFTEAVMRSINDDILKIKSAVGMLK